MKLLFSSIIDKQMKLLQLAGRISGLWRLTCSMIVLSHTCFPSRIFHNVKDGRNCIEWHRGRAILEIDRIGRLKIHHCNIHLQSVSGEELILAANIVTNVIAANLHINPIQISIVI